jgi:hypothetical protein
MSAATRKWTRALLRRALEDDQLFDELRRASAGYDTEEQLRAAIQHALTWQRRTPGEPYFCSYCGRPTDPTKGEVIVQGRLDRRDERRYRAVCHRCAGKGERSDAGWES